MTKVQQIEDLNTRLCAANPVIIEGTPAGEQIVMENGVILNGTPGIPPVLWSELGHAVQKLLIALYLKSFEQMVSAMLSNGGNVRILGFGNFHTSKRTARRGINPQTGQKIDIPAATVAHFSIGSGLKKALNPPPIAPAPV